MDYDDMRRLACGLDGITMYTLDRLLLLHAVEMQTADRDDLSTLMQRQWYRQRALINGLAKAHLERSRASVVGRKWRDALEPGVLP